MYTIGTSSLKFLRTKIVTDHPDAFAALDKRMLAFVGTSVERIGDASHSATLIAPYSAFFQFTDATKTKVQLYVPQDTTDPSNLWPLIPNAWLAVDTPFDQAFITEWLTPAGGLANGLYAMQRGNLADVNYAFAYPGMAYFAKDKQELYIHNGVTWVRVTTVDVVSLGTMVAYPEQFTLTTEMQKHWMRCDGHELTAEEQQRFPAFAAFIADKFGTGKYTMPFQNNMIIRVVV
jgi:hypothetical protein